MDAHTIDELADTIFTAIEDGDIDRLRSLWADDVEVWHNTDGIAQTKDESLAIINWMVRQTTSIEYRDVRRTIGDSGFAQHHVLHLTFDEGEPVDVPTAIFVEFRDDHVVRVDEYLDSAHATAAFVR